MVDKIVRLSGVSAGDNVIEIGPGLGSLTLGLADVGATVIAIEADRYLLPGLREVMETAGLIDRVTIHHADADGCVWAYLVGTIRDDRNRNGFVQSVAWRKTPWICWATDAGGDGEVGG